MVYAAYEYFSDDGTTYQVVLPSDFAVAMGYVNAVGTEPYLPGFVTPRYATYHNPGLGIWSSIVCTGKFNAVTPPQTVQVGSVLYSLMSAYGEQRNGLPFPNIQTVSGPQGPAGAAGAQGPAGATGATGPAGATGVLSVSTAAQPTTGTISATAFTTACSLSLLSGSYILFGNLVAASNAPNNFMSAQLFNTTDSATIGLPTVAQMSITSDEQTVIVFGTVTIASTKTIALQAKCSATTVTYSATQGNGLLAIKYA